MVQEWRPDWTFLAPLCQTNILMLYASQHSKRIIFELICRHRSSLVPKSSPRTRYNQDSQSTVTHCTGVSSTASPSIILVRNSRQIGKVIASCGQDGKMILVTNEKPEVKLLEHNFYPNVKPTQLTSCAFSPSSKYIAVGSVDSLIKVWDLRGQNQKESSIMQIKSHMCGVTSLAWVRKYRSELGAS